MNAALRRIDAFLCGLDGNTTPDNKQLKETFLKRVERAVVSYRYFHPGQSITHTASTETKSHREDTSTDIIGVTISLNSKNFTLVLYKNAPTSDLYTELDDPLNKAHRKQIPTYLAFKNAISNCLHNIDGWVNRMPKFVELWTRSLQTNSRVSDLKEDNNGVLDIPTLQKYSFKNNIKQTEWSIELIYNMNNNPSITLRQHGIQSFSMDFEIPDNEREALNQIAICQITSEYTHANDPDNV